MIERLPCIWRLAALIGATGMCVCVPAAAQTTASDGAPPQVVTITADYTSELRPYTRFLPGIREFRDHHALAPAASLRFGLVTGSFPMKPLPLLKASLEPHSLLFKSTEWSEDVAVQDDGWFTLPDSPEAERRKADLVIARRSSANVSWMIDVHTPGMAPQIYRLGDLRLECRVYLAIEWAVWHGTLLMGRRSHGVTAPPMDAACGGAGSVFVNTRPWPQLQAYVLREGGRTVRHELHGLRIDRDSFSLDLAPAAETWSDEALVEFVFAGAATGKIAD